MGIPIAVRGWPHGLKPVGSAASELAATVWPTRRPSAGLFQEINRNLRGKDEYRNQTTL